jgi:hypothetical protein
MNHPKLQIKAILMTSITSITPKKNTAQPRLKDLTLEQLRKLKPETKETPPAGRFCGRCHFPLTSKHSVNFDSSFHLIDLKEKKSNGCCYHLQCIREGVTLTCPSYARCPSKLRSKHPDEVDLKPHSEDDISKMIEKLETKAKKEELNRIREERKKCRSKSNLPGLRNIVVPSGMSKPQYLATLLRKGISMGMTKGQEESNEEVKLNLVNHDFKKIRKRKLIKLFPGTGSRFDCFGRGSIRKETKKTRSCIEEWCFSLI